MMKKINKRKKIREREAVGEGEPGTAALAEPPFTSSAPPIKAARLSSPFPTTPSPRRHRPPARSLRSISVSVRPPARRRGSSICFAAI
ncbi:hypothetical protein ZWY2020_016733 [Hordeum vulgare]|nr:hypothetical protein ZWY2020_016733 [Hordeum vulgare]